LSLVAALGDYKSFSDDPQLARPSPSASLRGGLHYPTTDFMDVELVGRIIGSRAKLMFGVPPEEYADLIQFLSPVHLIRKDSTPVYYFHSVLSVEHSR